MRRQAKASSAGPNTRQAAGLRRYPVAFALLVALLACAGIGAPSAGAKIIHTFKEDFGSAAQPSFTYPVKVAVDPLDGDLLVFDAGANEKQQLEIKVASGAVGGTYQLTFGGQTTGWTGNGTVTCDGASTTITGVTTSTGALVNREQVKSTPGSCIKPGTLITSFDTGAGTITLSQATESNASSGSVSLSSDLAVSGSPSNPTGEQITSSLQEALEKLSSVGTENVVVSGSSASSPIARTITFVNALGGADVPPISCNGAGLTGTSPTCGATTTSAGVANGIERFNPDGTPDDFSALGTNLIDGRLGAGAQACGAEASSCDVTPQGFLWASESTQPIRPNEMQIAVDRSGGVTDGDIFISQGNGSLIDIFAADGHYIGQLTEYRQFSSEKQKVNFTGTWASGFDTFELGNLPPDCSASSVGPFTYTTQSTLVEEAKVALNAACGVNSGSPNIGNTLGFSNILDFSRGIYQYLDEPQLTCTRISGAGSCSVETITQGGVPAPSGSGNGVGVGIAISPTGNLYIGGIDVRRWVPSANPPLLADNVFNFSGNVVQGNANGPLAAGVAGSSGFLFVSTANVAGVRKIDALTGAFKYVIGDSNSQSADVVVNPANGRVLVAKREVGEQGGAFVEVGKVATEYDASGTTEATQTSTLTAASGILGLAVDGPTGDVYVARLGASKIEVFGPPVPTPTPLATAASDVGPAQATLNGSINAEGTTVTSCVFEYGPTTAYGSSKPCEGDTPADSSPHAVSVQVSGLDPNGATYHYRIVAANSNGSDQSADRTFATGSSATTEPATSIANTTATLNGSVNPVGLSLTECKFEYGTALDYGQSKSCAQSLGSIEPDFQGHAVSATLTGLAPNTLYHFRFVAKSSLGTVLGADRSFTTGGAPQIVEPQPLEVSQTAATLQARINPSGLATTYHFEWGPEGSNPNRIPADHELFAGSGSELVIVSSEISGLQPASHYQFRVVAANADGTTVSDAQRLETMNANGLPDNRAFELVTPVDKGPAGSVNVGFTSQDSGPSANGDSFIWPLQNGMPGTTVGGWLRLKANRGPDGWTSTQVSAPSLISPPEIGEGGAGFISPSLLDYVNPDDTCGLLETFNPLTADTSQTSVELGITNLYLWREVGDGIVSYELVTDRLPLNPQAHSEKFYAAKAGDDCGHVYFTTDYKWIAGASGLYEWEASTGQLRDAGVRPDGSVGPNIKALVPPAVFGGLVDSRGTSQRNAVSAPGSRFFFTAVSNAGSDSGNPAVFMRENGGEHVVDVSQSQTAVPTGYARYEAASPDGGKVVFAANYGIAASSSAGPTNGNCDGSSSFNSVQPVEKIPCDLYVYDVETGSLTDVSADPNPNDPIGAAVQGAVAVDEDGSHVYFAALGQLVPGKGRTYAENIAGEGSVNVYLSAGGQLTYVTNVEREVVRSAKVGDSAAQLYRGLLMRGLGRAQTDTDGGRLLYLAADKQNWYDSGKGGVAYLFDADTHKILCVSCRPDGQPASPSPFGNVGFDGRAVIFSNNLSADGSRVFFTSTDALALGAEQGKQNVYEWEEGQVSFLAVAERAGGPAIVFEDYGYDGMSEDGATAFLGTIRKLAPQDRDIISDVYAVRENGGFPFVEPSPECQVDEGVPLLPNQIYCQGEKTPQPGASSPASSSFSGSGNPPASEPKPPAKRCSKGKVRRQGRCVKRHRRHERAHKRAHQRAVNTDRGGAK